MAERLESSEVKKALLAYSLGMPGLAGAWLLGFGNLPPTGILCGFVLLTSLGVSTHMTKRVEKHREL